MMDRIKYINERINGKKNEPKDKKPINNKPTTQNLVKKMRNLREQDEETHENRKTIYDQKREEEKFRNNFDDLNVAIQFYPLEIYDNWVYWGGIIDGAIEFAYSVTSDDDTSEFRVKYVDDLNKDDPDNQEIVERIESYYGQFFKYWRDNILQT